LALDLAHSLTGSAPGLLARTKLKVSDAEVTLKLPKEDAAADIFTSEGVERRLGDVASHLGLTWRFG